MSGHSNKLSCISANPTHPEINELPKSSNALQDTNREPNQGQANHPLGLSLIKFEYLVSDHLHEIDGRAEDVIHPLNSDALKKSHILHFTPGLSHVVQLNHVYNFLH